MQICLPWHSQSRFSSYLMALEAPPKDGSCWPPSVPRLLLRHIQVFPNVTKTSQLERLVGSCARANALLVTTLVAPEMRTLAQQLADEHNVQTVDLIGNSRPSLLIPGALHKASPGRMHQTNEDYFRRIEAVNSPSRPMTAKSLECSIIRRHCVGWNQSNVQTSSSVFLAHKGYKVSNVPVVLDRPCPTKSLTSTNAAFSD